MDKIYYTTCHLMICTLEGMWILIFNGVYLCSTWWKHWWEILLLIFLYYSKNICFGVVYDAILFRESYYLHLVKILFFTFSKNFLLHLVKALFLHLVKVLTYIWWKLSLSKSSLLHLVKVLFLHLVKVVSYIWWNIFFYI